MSDNFVFDFKVLDIWCIQGLTMTAAEKYHTIGSNNAFLSWSRYRRRSPGPCPQWETHARFQTVNTVEWPLISATTSFFFGPWTKTDPGTISVPTIAFFFNTYIVYVVSQVSLPHVESGVDPNCRLRNDMNFVDIGIVLGWKEKIQKHLACRSVEKCSL